MQLTPEQYTAGLPEHGLPEDFASLVMYLFTIVLDDRNEQLGDGVQQAWGREPRDFDNYARDTAVARIWSTKP